MPRRILILLAHPAASRSAVSVRLAKRAARLDGVTMVDLYAEYPTFVIDVDREQERLLAHDVVIFQHPFYWYSTPSILKEWQDLVLEHGWAYGDTGDKLKGKLFFSALSAGGPVEAYRAGGYNGASVRQLLLPLERTALLCQMTYLPPFVLFSAVRARADGRIDAHETAYLKLLEALRDGTFDVAAAQAGDTLNAVDGVGAA